jgi:undecaprenyl-phosphate 4-deoxy-4-formamido-L-arabinose transferase
MKVAVVIPVYNGASTIGRLVEQVKAELAGTTLEFVLVNDGSSDNSEEVCIALAQQHKEVKFIQLRKNFGEHNAVMCGLNYVTHDCAVIIDDDFQNPPSEIKKLVKVLEEGYDVAYSQYKNKQHSTFRNLGSAFHNKFANWLLDKPKDLYLSSFKAVRTEVIREIVKYKGPFPYVDGLILRVTNNIGKVYTDHHARSEGKSNYTLRKLVSLYLNMFLNFSIKPLRLFTMLGFISFAVGILFSVLFTIEKLLYPETPIGWTSSIIAIFVFSGVQLMFLGLIGEYLGKSYLDQNETPQWVVKKVYE